MKTNAFMCKVSFKSRFFILAFSISISCLAFAADTNTTKPTITPKSIPDAKCTFKSISINSQYAEALPIENNEMQLAHFEIWTLRKGNEQKDPLLKGYIRLYNGTIHKTADRVGFPLTLHASSWSRDKHTGTTGVFDVSYNSEVTLGNQTYSIVFQRIVKDVQNPVVEAELQLYIPGTRSNPIFKANCETAN